MYITTVGVASILNTSPKENNSDGIVPGKAQLDTIANPDWIVNEDWALLQVFRSALVSI